MEIVELYCFIFFSVLLSFVSGEDTQDRTDRVMLTPWVKFLWEAYRNVLELLRNNARVEKLYHDTAQQGRLKHLKLINPSVFMNYLTDKNCIFFGLFFIQVIFS